VAQKILKQKPHCEKKTFTRPTVTKHHIDNSIWSQTKGIIAVDSEKYEVYFKTSNYRAYPLGQREDKKNWQN